MSQTVSTYAIFHHDEQTLASLNIAVE